MLKKYDGTNWNTASYGKYFSGTEQFTNFPLVIRSLDQSVQAYTIKGNTQTSGTPSPQNPVTVDGVGEETANLFSTKNATQGKYLNSSGVLQSSENFTVTDYINIEPSTTYIISPVSDVDLIACHCYYDAGKNFISSVTGQKTNQLLDTPATAAYIRCSWRSLTTHDIMMNKGSTLLPYEPADMYKISILKDLQPLPPIYLSQPLFNFDNGNSADTLDSSGTFTKNIQYIVLTGNETFTVRSSPEHSFSFGFSSNNYSRGVARMGICSHFPSVTSADKLTDGTSYFGTTGFSFRIDTLDTLTDCTNYLKAQYAAGTPVTFIYCLSTAETESVAVPTITTTGGEVTLDIDTTVKPSEMSLTYNGKHLNKSKKYNGNNWT